MSHIVHKTLQTYYEACMHYNLREKDVTSLRRKGTVVIIDTKEKSYLKTIKR